MKKIIISAIILFIILLTFLAFTFMSSKEKPNEPEIIGEFEWFQKENTNQVSLLQNSDTNEDSYIGIDRSFYYCYDCDPWDKPWEYEGDDYHESYANTEVIDELGLKWIHTNPSDFHGDPLDWQHVEKEPGKYKIAEKSDKVMSYYADNGVNIILGLSVGNGKNRPDKTKFESQDDVDRYVKWVRFMVNHFKNRIKYYEIWNEPDTDGPSANITWENYVKIVKAVAPVIKEECRDCKVVIGAIGGVEPKDPQDRGLDYLENVLRSGVAPLADFISWHPMFGTRLAGTYYEEYSGLVEEKIRKVAESEGFRGKYIVTELSWSTRDIDNGTLGFPVSNIVANKNLARGLILHRGLDIMATFQGKYLIIPNHKEVVKNINTVLAGYQPEEFPLTIQSESDKIRYYTFSSTDGKLITIWDDIEGVNDYDGIEVGISSGEFLGKSITAVDILNGYEQSLVVTDDKIAELIVRDYPIALIIK